MQVPVIAERRSSGWARTGTLMGGTDDSDTNPKMSENSMDIEDLAPPPGGNFSAYSLSGDGVLSLYKFQQKLIKFLITKLMDE